MANIKFYIRHFLHFYFRQGTKVIQIEIGKLLAKSEILQIYPKIEAFMQYT